MADTKKQGKVRIAIDLGASSGRVIAGVMENGKLTLTEIHRFENPTIELPSGLYWNILGLFHEITTGLKKAIETHGENVASIAIDTWGCDFGLFDNSGELIGPPHQYRDPRFEGMAEKMHGIMSEDEIFSLTGIKTNFYNSALHLLALKSKDRVALSQATTLLFIPDILAYWLTGVKAVEKTIASTSQLLDAETGQWSQQVITALGLPLRIFGKIVPPGTILGELRPELKNALGRCDIPFVIAPCHDTASAVAGIPLSESEPLWLSSGTWSIMGVEIKQPVRSYDALSYGFCNELGIDNSVRFLKNIAGLWLIQECKRQWERDRLNHSFGELTTMAADAEQFIAFIDPDDEVFASPGNMPKKIQNYCDRTGQKVPSSIGEILRVTTDSLALKYKFVFERIKKLTNRDYAKLHAGGGGILNEALCQATANALGIEVQAGPVEATSCGNLVTQMIATGELSGFPAARKLIRESFESKAFLPEDTETWTAAYAKFLAATGLEP
ncbi:MAG: rhamnulokinase [Verrucomicrobia bacterium]|nr:rhamnulokinase [Verrucomicrobiota bacterium]